MQRFSCESVTDGQSYFRIYDTVWMMFMILFFYSLQQYPVPENKTGTHVIELLTKRILALGATQQGQFLVDCESYLSHPQMG